MGFFSFLKKKAGAEEGIPKGIEPLKLDINLPPVEPVAPHPRAPETPEVPPYESPSFGSGHSAYGFSQSAEQPSSFREAEAHKSEMAEKDVSRSLDLLSAKLDAIKLMIENLGHRIDKMEAEKKKETIRW